MQTETCEIIIYTQSGALTFEVIVSANDFKERLASALEQGTVMLDTAEGSKLVLNAINVVAIEVHEPTTAEEIFTDTPPTQNI